MMRTACGSVVAAGRKTSIAAPSTMAQTTAPSSGYQVSFTAADSQPARASRTVARAAT